MLYDQDTTEAFETEPQNVASVCDTLFIHRFLSTNDIVRMVKQFSGK